MLHGELKVNGREIGSWEALRKEEVSPGRFRYATRVNFGGVTEGSVEHNFADGAAALAAKVLSTTQGGIR